ncbi:MAG: FAD binding domain-containing protein [Conexivisphaerales archaeon]
MSFITPYFTLPKFTYYKPDSISEALSLLKQHNGKARVLAGGVMLVNMMKERIALPEYVIDLKGIRELKGINVTERGVEIGSTVTASELQQSDIIKKFCQPLAKAASYMGDKILQNSVTIGGNISIGMPSTDGLPALMSMGALLEVRSADSARMLPSSDLVVNIGRTNLRSDEMITKIIVPNAAESKGTYVKFLNASEIAIATVAVSLMLVQKKLRIVVGAISAKPYYFDESSIGWRWDENIKENIKTVADAIGSNLKPISDAVAGSEYRREVSKILVARALKELFGGT